MSVDIGQLYVRRCALIAATAAQIWEHFESFDQLNAWFGIGHILGSDIPGAKGEICLSVERQGRRRNFGGKIVVWKPGQELSIDNNWFDDDLAWPVSTYFSFRLHAIRGDTLVELFHHGFEHLGANAANEHEGYESAWKNQHLVALKKLVESR